MSESIRGSRGFGFPQGHLLIFLKLDNNNKVIIVVNDVERHRCATQIIPNAKVPPEANAMGIFLGGHCWEDFHKALQQQQEHFPMVEKNLFAFHKV